MYESFGLNIGEAMAVRAFPVVYDLSCAARLWAAECPFAGNDEAVAPISSSRPGPYRNRLTERFGLDRR